MRPVGRSPSDVEGQRRWGWILAVQSQVGERLFISHYFDSRVEHTYCNLTSSRLGLCWALFDRERRGRRRSPRLFMLLSQNMHVTAERSCTCRHTVLHSIYPVVAGQSSPMCTSHIKSYLSRSVIDSKSKPNSRGTAVPRSSSSSGAGGSIQSLSTAQTGPGV